MTGRIVVVTGVMASGKSTVADLLARRFERGVHVRGDVFRRMIVSGRASFDQVELAAAAAEQWRLRLRLAAQTANAYADAGFDVVVQDIVIGDALPDLLQTLTAPSRYLVVLTPDVETVRARETSRAKTGYSGRLTVEQHHRAFHDTTPRLGLWLDNAQQTPEQTVDEISRRLDEARLSDMEA